MSSSYLVQTRSILIGLCLSVYSLAGCQIEENELLSWKKDDHGHLKIASYIVDTQRPVESRKKGLQIIAEGRHYDDIFSIYKHLELDETTADAEINFVTSELLSVIEAALNISNSPEQQTVAAELAFYLMSIKAPRQKIAQRADIIQALIKWSLGYLRTGREAIVPSYRAGTSRVREAHTTPSDVLLSVLHITQSVDNSKAVFDQIKADLADNISKVDYVLRVHKVVHKLRNPVITQEMAIALLATARKTYPDGVTVKMVEAMIENQNETLLRFLIEICRDQRVNFNALKLGINNAADKALNLGLQAEVLNLMRRVLSSTNAYSNITFLALRWALEAGEKDDLAQTLKSISPNFSAPVSGTDMKNEVDNFCVEFMESKKDELRETWIELLRDLKDQPELWPARLYTLSCIHLLYPDDFPQLMRRNRLYKRYYQTDKTRISAWRDDRPVTISDIASEYQNPMH